MNKRYGVRTPREAQVVYGRQTKGNRIGERSCQQGTQTAELLLEMDIHLPCNVCVMSFDKEKCSFYFWKILCMLASLLFKVTKFMIKTVSGKKNLSGPTV